MGIDQLLRIITEKVPEAITEKDFSDYRGKTIVIDANGMIHGIIVNFVKHGKLSDNAVIKAIWDKHVSFLRAGIKVIWVFDGKPPSLKAGVLKKRRVIREKAEEALKSEELSDEERDKLAKKTVRITAEDVKDARRLCELAGVPFIVAKSEADPQCAAFTSNSEIWGVASDDIDTIAFGATRMLKSFSNHKTVGGIRKKILEIELEKVISGLGFKDYYQLAQYCVLLKCDYCEKKISVRVRNSKEYGEPRNWAEQARLRLIKYGDIKGVIDSCIKANEEAIYDAEGIPNIYFTIPSNYLENSLEAYDAIINAEVYDPSEIDLKWVVGNKKGLEHFLISEKKFPEKMILKIDNSIELFNLNFGDKKNGGANKFHSWRSYQRVRDKLDKHSDNKKIKPKEFSSSYVSPYSPSFPSFPVFGDFIAKSVVV